jgi:hypothetical protein
MASGQNRKFQNPLLINFGNLRICSNSLKSFQFCRRRSGISFLSIEERRLESVNESMNHSPEKKPEAVD